MELKFIGLAHDWGEGKSGHKHPLCLRCGERKPTRKLWRMRCYVAPVITLGAPEPLRDDCGLRPFLRLTRKAPRILKSS